MSTFIYKDRVQLCYDEKIGAPFDETTNNILNNCAKLSSVPTDFLLPPFITAVSHFLNKSEINPWGNWTQPAIIYSATVGFTGTNKTAALDIVRDSITQVEFAKGMTEMSSRINQSATVESLLKQLNNDSRQIQLWDELKTWQSSLGLYKTGAASDYDTTIYLTAYNGGTLKRQTCSSNISIRKPVVNICGMTHPGEICKCLDEERKNSNNNDGLYSRFLMCMPKPQFEDACVDEITDSHIPSLARVFYVIDQMHKDKKMYVYDSEAKHVAMDFYNEQQEFLRENHSLDTYTSGVIGKLKGQTQRLAMIVQAVDNATKVLNEANCMSSGQLDKDFLANVKGVIDNTDDSGVNTAFITAVNTKRATEIAKYFFQQKKLLAGYSAAGVLVSPVTSNSLAKKILLHPGLTVFCNAITKSTRCNAEQVKNEMKNLSDLGLGESKQEKPQGGGRLMIIFIKVDTNKLSLEETVIITQKLASLGTSLEEFEQSFVNNENTPPLKKLKVNN